MTTQVITQVDPEIKQDINSIVIPDLWWIAEQLSKKDEEMVLEVWHLCHSLKKHIIAHKK